MAMFCEELVSSSGSLLVNVTEAVSDVDGPVVSVPGKRGGSGSGETSGMWFGPRLGKRSKRGADVPWTIVTVRGKFTFLFHKLLPGFLNQ